MGYRVAHLAAVLLVLASVTSAASVEKKCPAGDMPKCTVNIEYKTLMEKYPHPHNCDWYFLCSNGVPYCMQCPEGLIYNPDTERCDNTKRMDCYVETTPAPTTPTTPTTPEPTTIPTTPEPTTIPTTPEPTTIPTTPEPTTPEPTTIPTTPEPTTPQPTSPPTDPLPQCPACARDGPTFRHPTNCQWFYECTNGIPVLRQCVNGLHWNAKLQVCDYPCLAQCDSGSQSILVPVQPEKPAPSACPAARAPACPAHDPRLAVLLPHPTSCEFYYECSNGVAYCMPCPAGEYFNPTLKVCDYPDHSGCGVVSGNIEPYRPGIPADSDEVDNGNSDEVDNGNSNEVDNGNSNVVKPTNGCPEFEASVCPAHDPKMAVLLPHPRTCEWYIECSNGSPYCMPCPAGEYFNPELKVCDYKDHSGCKINN